MTIDAKLIIDGRNAQLHIWLTMLISTSTKGHTCRNSLIMHTHVTARDSSWGKVMFSQACVKNSVHRGVGVHGKGACMPKGICIAGGVHDRGACVAEDYTFKCENAWWVGGGGCAWQERRPLQHTVRILLECILVLVICLELHQKNY